MSKHYFDKTGKCKGWVEKNDYVAYPTSEYGCDYDIDFDCDECVYGGGDKDPEDFDKKKSKEKYKSQGFLVFVKITPTPDIAHWMLHWNNKHYPTKEVAEDVGRSSGKEWKVVEMFIKKEDYE